MEAIVDTKEGVTQPLNGMNLSKALEPDELHPRVLEELATDEVRYFPTFSSCQLTEVKSLKNCNLQT